MASFEKLDGVSNLGQRSNRKEKGRAFGARPSRLCLHFVYSNLRLTSTRCNVSNLSMASAGVPAATRMAASAATTDVSTTSTEGTSASAGSTAAAIIGRST